MLGKIALLKCFILIWKTFYVQLLRLVLAQTDNYNPNGSIYVFVFRQAADFTFTFNGLFCTPISKSNEMDVWVQRRVSEFCEWKRSKNQYFACVHIQNKELFILIISMYVECCK